MADNDLRNPGLFQTSRMSGEKAPKFEMRFGQSERLGDFIGRYQFFSPALLYLYGRFTDEPFIQYMAEKNGNLKLMYRKFRHSLFRDMDTPDGDPDWNYVLWAVERDHWPDLERFLVSVMFFDHHDRWMMKVGSMDVSIIDPLGADRNLGHPSVESVPIVILGVDGNRQCVAVEPREGNFFRPPCVKFHPPQKKTVKLAAAMFADKEDPTDALKKRGKNS